MKVAMISGYSIEEYHKFGKKIYWSTPRGVYDAFTTKNIVEYVLSGKDD